MKSTFAQSIVLFAASVAAAPTPSTSTFWSGARTANATVTGSFANLRVPSLREYNVTANAAAVIGIDTIGCPNSLRAGVRWSSTPASDYHAYIFTQWGSEAPHIFEADITPGDYLEVSIRATSLNTGAATIRVNTDNSKVYTMSYTGKPTLCRKSADWGITDENKPLSSSSTNNLGDFDAVVFYGAGFSAIDSNGKNATYTSQGAPTTKMYRGNHQFAHATQLFFYQTQNVAVWYDA